MAGYYLKLPLVWYFFLYSFAIMCCRMLRAAVLKTLPLWYCRSLFDLCPYSAIRNQSSKQAKHFMRHKLLYAYILL